MKQLKLSIKPKQEPNDGQCLRSSGYSVKINDWELGRGVTGFRLEMPANGKPKITIDFTPDIIETNGVVVDPQVSEVFEQAYSDFIAKTQKKQEQAEQDLQDVAKSLSIIERYISLRQSFTRKGWEEINSLYDYQLNEKERNLSKDITLNDSETNAFRKYAQRTIGII
ncbi:hypothetical protein [Streptococcus sp. HMSC070B10]|uniref:hypothetical protein n=1 Tax=Streptococcus sp. HMSC070B10 TaxID=1715092 RepID=UPI0008B4B383|nr:hypothetical protein [Streptococcus sp. HMSC070B10]OFO03801.1 hypothetical protein HMPREF2613_00650 [Streptococcus sp. HMSC070B10]